MGGGKVTVDCHFQPAPETRGISPLVHQKVKLFFVLFILQFSAIVPDSAADISQMARDRFDGLHKLRTVFAAAKSEKHERGN
jgi:hypothetical protein